MNLYAQVCMGVNDLLPLRRRDPVSQLRYFVFLQRMRQQRTLHRTGTVLLVRVQVRLSRLGNKADLLINPTKSVPDRARFHLSTTRQSQLEWHAYSRTRSREWRPSRRRMTYGREKSYFWINGSIVTDLFECKMVCRYISL